MRAGRDVRDDLGLGRIRHRRLEDADDDRGSIAQAHLADNGVAREQVVRISA